MFYILLVVDIRISITRTGNMDEEGRCKGPNYTICVFLFRDLPNRNGHHFSLSFNKWSVINLRMPSPFLSFPPSFRLSEEGLKGGCEKSKLDILQLCMIHVSSTEFRDFHLPPVKVIEINMMIYAQMHI